MYTEDPSASNNSDPIASIFTKDHKWGFYITDVKFENMNLPGGWKKKVKNNYILWFENWLKQLIFNVIVFESDWFCRVFTSI